MVLQSGIEKPLEFARIIVKENNIIIFYLIILMVKILVFDTETSGLPPEMSGKNWEERDAKSKQLLSISDYKKHKSMWSSYIESWPSIVQLSYILYDTLNPEDSKIFNKYIDIPDEITITEGSMAIHHITKESIAAAADINRAKIYDALDEFMDDVEKADVVVGHNVQFDRKMIIAELTRVSKEHKIPQITKMMNDSNFICTMEKTQPVCNLKREISYIDKKTGESKVFYKIKPPKLMESYKHYFGYEPAGEALHDAIIDVVVCLRVYCMSLEDGFDVCGTNSMITDYIVQISPSGYTCEGIIANPVSSKKKSASKKSASKKPPKKKKLSTIIEETEITSPNIIPTISLSKKVKSKSKSKSPPAKSRSVTSKYKSKSKSKSKTKTKRKNEMSDFIVDDDI